ncbi:TIM-barrel domain-containing protein [Catalinimonas niigatensis]|uniref:TIM-barrel domain-containing protein n=1 Tax=Catalinimonas niigatensis TaxID=1397264 RepID=UPI0026661D68|nr:TIM-barrel domain-containing protein [Catalinimonas niigatensis]WPP50835.1 glycoside hydrolase family 31 protein [Catalinimonas niigatensis]
MYNSLLNYFQSKLTGSIPPISLKSGMEKRSMGMYILIFILGQTSCTDKQNVENQGNLEWNKEAAGVWKISFGSPDTINLLSELDITSRLDAIAEMGEDTLPFAHEDISFEVVDGKIYIRFPLEKEEKIFGLGLNFKTVEQRGRIMRLHVDHYGGEDDGRTHAPVPFFVSSRGYGALINAARYIDVWAGTSVRKDSKNPPVIRDRNTDPEWSAQPYSDNLEFLVPADGVEVIVFAGKTMLDVVRRYNLMNGGGTLPPKWGLGFWQRVPTLYTDKDVQNEVNEFEKRGFPLNVVGLEPGWMTRSYPCTYEWDTSRFEDPESFVEGLKEKHIRTNLWINPYVSPDGELYTKIKPYTSSHTVWNGLVPDYTMSEVQKIMTDHFKKHQLNMGVSGYKMDENDGYDSWLWPDVATFPSGTSAEQMRQIYGSLMQKVTTKMYQDENLRTYGLVRGANAGTSSFPFVLYNDYYNHRDFITALINSSFIGVLWTPEVRASQTSEEWLRRMQTVCFSPLAMINAWADGTKPWSFPDVAEDVNAIAKLRMRLIPYLYTAFADYTFQGIPPMRAMNLEAGYAIDPTLSEEAFDATENPYAMAVKQEVKDQFMVGPSVLVAPLFDGEKERKVILPQGKWYDFYTGALVGEGEVITASPGLSKIPVYVKDGGIIPLFPEITRLDNRKHPLEIRHYGNKPNVYELYDDDGETYDYKNGEFTRIGLHVVMDTEGNKSGKVVIPDGKNVWSFSDYQFRFMTE